MFETQESSKSHFLLQAKAAREERAIEKDRELASCRIQKCFRNWLNRKHLTSEILKKFNDYFSKSDESIVLKPATEIYEFLFTFLIIYNKDRDRERMENLYKYLVRSLDSESPLLSYVGVALSKNCSLFWISQVKKVLSFCLQELKDLCPQQQTDYASILLRLHMLISFTSTGTWAIMRVSEMEKLKAGMNQLCANVMGYLVNCNFYAIMQTLLINGFYKNNVQFQPVALTAITTLTIRPILLSKMSDKLMFEYINHIFSVPALVHYVTQKDQSPSLSLWKKNNLFLKIINFLSSDQNRMDVFKKLSGNYILCLLANLLDLADKEIASMEETDVDNFTTVVTKLLEFCQQYAATKEGHTSYWHPILGWFDQPEDYSIREAIPIIKTQLSYLWIGNIIVELMSKPLNLLIKNENQNFNLQSSSNNPNIFQRKFLEVTKKNNKKKYYQLGSPETTKIAAVCSLYQTALCTLREMKFVILTGLCYNNEKILSSLWLFLQNLGSCCGLKSFLDHLTIDLNCSSPEFQMLILFCDCMQHYITILDDIEMYEQQDPFKLSDFVTMSYFLNQFLFKSVYNNLLDVNSPPHKRLFYSLHSFFVTIYRRDCHKSFCTPDHWLIKEVRVSSFMSDLQKNKHNAPFFLSKMPHILPHDERVSLFRKYITEEKASLGLTDNMSNISSTMITVHRSKIVEDGYRQLSVLPAQALKGLIRVRFINEQGLDEAGIDQDGVFKEFLEETIKRVFDPSLNLFKVTSENRLYPSSSSSLQENHLLLFEFVGRMLGKAVYEGIVVDVPFASFFVSQFCGQTGGILYSWLDELASFDPDLYRSLTMVKRFEGDVSQLELTFSFDENVMGRIITHELKPGGRVIPVTNENKINYIHLMARFRMYVQIKDQISAFTKGFRSIISPNWLSLFSSPEWQRLISGDNVPLDIRDLRKHTQYYGGFHDKHRVISWLWDILEKDFSEQEKALFLKFVTSCSKSPLLGFAHLEPPFSIRCVEVGDDEDTGDTIGSVIRGFFTIRKKDPQNRLPTSSTCFNLLKLPNYRKKSILREKLRYAVASNTGFELS